MSVCSYMHMYVSQHLSILYHCFTVDTVGVKLKVDNFIYDDYRLCIHVHHRRVCGSVQVYSPSDAQWTTKNHEWPLRSGCDQVFVGVRGSRFEGLSTYKIMQKIEDYVSFRPCHYSNICTH